MSERRLRVLIAKVGLDGHDRGAKVLAAMLRDAGHEVIYLGLYNTPEDVVRSAIEENVDVIGLSFLSAEHLTLAPRVMESMKRHGVDDIPVVVGGIMPPEDEKPLLRMGVAKVFRGSLVRDFDRYLQDVLARRLEARESDRR